MPTTKPLPDAMLNFPRQVQIEPVGQCNLRCTMCSLRFRRKQDEGPAFMHPGLFKDLVDQFRGVEELHLQGLGEPLLHPSFFDMVVHACSRGIRVSTNSNMTLLTPERAEECVRSGLSWMRVSIDGASPETYASIRMGSCLETVLENLSYLKCAKERLGSTRPRLFLVMVLMKKNMAELPDVVRLAHEYGMEQVFVQHLCSDLSEGALPAEYGSLTRFVEEQSVTPADRRRLQPHFNAALAEAGRLGIALRLPHIGAVPAVVARQARKRCDWPWRSAYITYDGVAMPCCMIGLPERMKLGNAAQERFMSIWNGEAYRNFRSRLESDDPPAVCRTCSLYHGTF